MSFCSPGWWRHCRASLRERGIELSYAWRRALLPNTFLFLHFFFCFANSELPSSIHLRGVGGSKFLWRIQTWAVGTSLGLVPAPNSTAGPCHMNELAFTAKRFDLRILVLFWYLYIQFLKVLIFCSRNAVVLFEFKAILQFLFLLDNFLAFTYVCLVFLTCFSCWLRGGCVCGGVLFAHKWLVSHMTMSPFLVPSGLTLGKKNLEFWHFSGTRIWDKENKRDTPSPSRVLGFCEW